VTTKKDNPISYWFSLDKITLNVGTAQVIALHVKEKTSSSASWDKYELSKK
jgi:hypothetical protein